jgi:hypothetical protein
MKTLGIRILRGRVSGAILESILSVQSFAVGNDASVDYLVT